MGHGPQFTGSSCKSFCNPVNPVKKLAPTNQKRWYEFLSLSLLLGLAAAIGALIFFSWLTDEVLEGDSGHFDEVTRAAVHQLASPLMTAIMRFLSFVGSTIVLAIGTTIVVIWFATRKWGREAKLFAATMIGAALLNITLKLTFKRARPTPFFDLTPPETYSFPSGHSLASACFFGALAAILTARIKNKRTGERSCGSCVRRCFCRSAFRESIWACITRLMSSQDFRRR